MVLDTNIIVLPKNGRFVGDYGLYVNGQMRVIDRAGKPLLKRDALTFENKELAGASLEQYTGDATIVRAHTKAAAAITARIFASQLMVARMK